jgi:hypothetical protein
MKLTRILSGILSLVYLVACGVPSARPNPSKLPTEPGITVSSPNFLPKETSESFEKEFFTATYTTQPTLTPTKLPSLTTSELKAQTPLPQCMGGNSPGKLPDNLELPGAIILDDGEQGKQLSGIPLTSSPLPIPETQDNEFFGVSPNGRWLAYAPYTRYQTEPRIETMKVVLVSTNGERIEHKLDIIHSFPEFGETMHPKGLPIYWFGGWINDDLLYVQIYYLEAPGITKTVRLHAVIDPFKGVWRNDLLTGYPSRYERHFVGISPDLTRVLYVRSEPTNIVLWSIDQQREIWSEPAFQHASEVFIRWSPDSKQVIFFKTPFDNEKDSHIYLADRDGNDVQKITSDDYPTPGFQATYAQWSPDGQYMAILEPGNVQTVYVYDNIDGSFIYQCSIEGDFRGLPGLQWSPDGKYLASFSYSTIHDDTPIYIIDFDKDKVYEIDQKGHVYGWPSSVFSWKP